MSEDKKVVSDDLSNGSAESKEEQYVNRKAYEEVSADMHKYKQQAREAAAAKAEYEAKLRQIEEEKMRENEQFKELSDKYKQELEQTKSAIREKDERFNSAVRKAALRQELGGSVREEYLSFAKVNEIEINEDGSLNMDSLRSVANKFREEHGSLLPPAKADSTSKAPPSGQTVSSGKSIDELSGKEAYEMLRNLKS